MSGPGKKVPLPSPERRRFLAGAGSLLAASVIRGRLSWAADSKGRPDDEIVSARIYPGIGVARLGNSQDPDGYFVGPEVTDPPRVKNGDTRDFAGAVKRQAARFRVYGYNNRGEVVRELTSEHAELTWRVHLANKKAQWYRFISALDLPEAVSLAAPRRNPDVAPADRSSLVIDAGLRSISNRARKPVLLNQGRFKGKSVSLGELRIDEQGRLLVLGGQGKSESPENKTIYNDADQDSFNNADGWYDDTSDGPVSATVRIGHRTIEAEPAWVLVAPINYAPNVVSWRTLYDLLIEVYVAQGWMKPPETTSFTQDVLPILRRLTSLQWVNQGFANDFGAESKWNFDDPSVITRICEPSSNADERKLIFASFRVVDTGSVTPFLFDPTSPTYRKLWPMLYGDAYGIFDSSMRNSLILDGVRLTHMKRWLDGQFTADWNPQAPGGPSKLSDVALADQPAMLSRAAMTFCIADAFHPGCEVTWPMRHASLYRDPGPGPVDESLLFRIKTRAESDSASSADYGDKLTQAVCLSNADDGPLQAQGPGDLTRWMALPWQGDTAFCRSGYEPELDPYLPTFWPARVPNHVLAMEDYQTVVDPAKTPAERVSAFKNRQNWFRKLTGTVQEQMLTMVQTFGEIGIVEAMPVPRDPSIQDIPPVVMVESFSPAGTKRTAPGGKPPPDYGAPSNQSFADALQEAKEEVEKRHPDRIADIERIVAKLKNLDLDKIRKSGWADLKQLIEFRLIKERKH